MQMKILTSMELNIAAKLYSSPSILSLILLAPFLIWLKLAKGKKLNLPPSPSKLPIIGNIHQLGKLPHRSLRDLSRKYGSLLLLQLGHNPTLVVSSAEMVREIVKNHDIVFSSRPSTTAANIFLYGRSDLVFAPYGEYWRQIRKICVLELLSLQKVHSFQFVREEEAELIINKIRRASVKGEPVNLMQLMMFFSNNVVSRCAVSRKLEEEDSNSKVGQLTRRMMSLFMNFCFGDMFPYLRWLDVLTGYIPSMKAVHGESDTFFVQIIEEHRAFKSLDKNNITDKDFLSILLQLQEDGMLEMDLSQENLKAVILDMFVAGTETTSATTEWLMAELLKNPNVMKKVQEEVRNVVGKKSKLDVNDINQMKYLNCVIKETLRLHPAVPLVLRATTASAKLGGYDIPSNIAVFINAWAIHRDPNWWEKPEEFIPERFENNPVDFKGQDFHFIPFGFGRRGCPGISFGVASVEYIIANFLYWFDWRLPAGQNMENLDMSELYGLSVSKKVPLHVVPVSHFSV
ncbi:hypothetical protein DITRI_Ditri09bG0057300 [Diplodiscus trichospermus]